MKKYDNFCKALANIYSDEQALYVIRKLKTDYIALFETLKNEINSRWLDS